MSQSSLSFLLKKLEIPPNFTRYENISGSTSISSLETWKQNAASVLQDILRIVQSEEGQDLSLETKAGVIFASVPFLPQYIPDENGIEQYGHEIESWVTSEAQIIAHEIASSPVLSPSNALVTQVLTCNLKPIFRSSPHPHLHLATGRKIPNPAGGPMAMQDYYEGQLWKQYPGIDKVVLWCIHGIQTDVYETIWHLLIPPVMALLDDYEARYKLRGVIIVQEMLQHVPRDLLQRTGVDGLLRQSLRASLSHLQSPETPLLLTNAIRASISLALLTTSISPCTKPSANRFDDLSSLLGEGIVSGIWLYSEDKLEVIKATFDALPALLRALSIGSVRFFKALIPQLTHTLIPRPMIDPDRQTQLSAIRVLETLLDVGRPRVGPWKETILDAIGRCWVGLVDEEGTATQVHGGPSATPTDIKLRREVKRRLQNLCAQLVEVCPSVVEEFPRFIQADRTLFEGLLPSNSTQ